MHVVAKLLILPFAIVVAAIAIPVLTAWHFFFDAEEFDAKG